MSSTRSTNQQLRKNIWRSIRIHRRFTIPDLCRSTDGSFGKIQQYVRQLVKHGFVQKNGGYGARLGEYQTYRIARDNGPEHPQICDRCGQAVTAKLCRPFKKEREKEKEKESEKEKEKEEPEQERLRSLLKRATRRGDVPEELKKHLEAKYNDHS